MAESPIAAGGLTSDHEAITARECWTRAQGGIGVMLRERRCGPISPRLLDALKEAPALVSRLMLTAGRLMPAFIRDHGFFVDHLIRTALERGVAPIDAYRMATLTRPPTWAATATSAALQPAATPTSACCAPERAAAGGGRRPRPPPARDGAR